MIQHDHEQYLLWLAHLQPGDEFAQPQYGRVPIIHTVHRTTRAQIITANGQRFSKGNGKELGRSGMRRIEPVTDAIRSRVAEAHDRSRFSELAYRPSGLTHAEVRAMLEARERARTGKKVIASPEQLFGLLVRVPDGEIPADKLAEEVFRLLHEEKP